MEKPDIKERQDLVLLVDSFYAKVKVDKLLGPVFSHLDWPKHLPVMYNFWSSMMLNDQTYNGNPFQVHRQLPIDKEHFGRWLALFKETVDEHFYGEKANEIKMRAGSIAGVFQYKLGLLKDRR